MLRAIEINTGDPSTAAVPGRLILGDALTVARALLSRESSSQGNSLRGKVRLVYVDPPFASQTNYRYEARLDGPADGRVVRSAAYEDRWGGEMLGPYLDMLAPRLEALTDLLAADGTIWVHVDYRASYLVRVLLDEILGRGAFKNEIVWKRAPNLGRQAASSQFGRTLDTLLVYGGPDAVLAPPTRLEPIAAQNVRWDDGGRAFVAAPRGDYTDLSVARLEKEGRVHRSATGKVYIKYFLVQNPSGQWCRERRVDALWTDVLPLRHTPATERTGYPTQKPRALLERVVACASKPGDVVVDLFCGSGTTAEAAYRLGRTFVAGDASPLAVAAARARLLRVGAPLSLEQCDAGRTPAGPAIEVRAERQGDAVHVRLLHPAEPLAWALDPRPRPRQPFRSVWHSERVPGARTRPALRDAVVKSSERRIRVRVWHDDGHMTECDTEVA